jgi:2-methylcitrate synthase
MTQPDIKRGLDGVIADESKISKVIAEKQYLTYRGYPVPALAEQCRFEEVVYLLWHGELPTQPQLDEFCQAERALRPIDAATINFIHQFPRDAHPMRMMQAAVAFLGMRDADAELMDDAANRQKAMKLLAQLPTVMAACLRHSQDQEYIPPCPDRSIAANFFFMCFDRQVPTGPVVKAFDASLTLYAEHGFNASTFTARVIASSLADMHSAIAGAIGSLKGPLHGGANEAVMHVLREIGTPARAQEWLENAFATRRKIMGFGHRLYKQGDSRVPMMKQYRDQTASILGGQSWIEISNILERGMIEQKNIHPNLDFPAGPTYYLMGFPIPFFTPIFVCARLSGWVAHILEQYGHNRLIRPSSHYTGVGERAIPPMASR